MFIPKAVQEIYVDTCRIDRGLQVLDDKNVKANPIICWRQLSADHPSETWAANYHRFQIHDFKSSFYSIQY